MTHLGKNLVIVACLLAAGAFASYMFLRSRIPEGNGFYDGTTTLSPGQIRDEVRLARWDHPQPLQDGFQTGLTETDPFVDSATGRVFFTTGLAHQDQQLWVAEPQLGSDPVIRPLDEINSDADDRSAAFFDGFLYFSSNRGGGFGGFDLYRARWTANGLQPAENLGEAINSEADDVDPVVRPVSRELYFASNRDPYGSADHDIYLCRMEGERLSRAIALEGLSSPYEERSPSFGPAGRVFVFASDRPGGEGGFDLYRSLWRDGRFDIVTNIGDPNSDQDDLGPAFADGGFTLYFSSDRAGWQGQHDLFVAHTRELFPLPSSGFSLLDFTLLFGLLLVALLAYLARRWETLDIIYKCVLLSLLFHLLILWLSRRVDIEVESAPSGPGESVYEVRLLAELLDSVSRIQDQARGDSVSDLVERQVETATSRGQLHAAAMEAQPVSTESLARARSSLAAAPAALPPSREAQHADPAPDLAVEAPHHRFEAYEGIAAELPVRDRGATSPRVETQNGAAQQVAAVQPRSGSTPARALAMQRVASSIGLPQVMARSHEPQQSTSRSTPKVVRTSEPSDFVALARAEERGEMQVAAAAISLPATENAVQGATRGDSSAALAASPPPSLKPQTTSLLARPMAGSSKDHALPRRAVLNANRAVFHAASVDAVAPADRMASTPQEHPAVTGLVMAAPAAEIKPRTTAELVPRRSMSAPQFKPSSAGMGMPIALEIPRPRAQGSPLERPRINPKVRKRETTPTPTPAVAKVQDRLKPTRQESRSTEDRVLRPLQVDTAPNSALDPLSLSPARGPFRAQLVAADLVPAPTRLPFATPRPAAPRLDRIAPRVPKLYERRTGDLKEIAIREGGGSRETEAAVLKGLRYLASVQRKLGYFGDRHESSMEEKYGDVRVGKTGLAVLAFLGAGHTPDSNTEFSANVRDGMDWLLDVQHEASGHFGKTASYGHGIATYALAECYAMTGVADLQEPLQLAVDHIVDMQKRGSRDRRLNGGWTYYYRNGPGFDSYPRASISSWQLMALKSATVGGLSVPDRALDSARDFFVNCYDEEYGYFRYNHDRNWLRTAYRTLPASTPASIFCLLLLGEEDNPILDTTTRWVMERTPRQYRYPSDDAFVLRGAGNLYYWYYGSLAMYLRGGRDWRIWNESMKNTLLPAQRSNGSWPAISNYARDIAGDDRDEETYSTALCVLSLEVYYRYFTPLLKRDQK